jgi:type 2A phosphatase activator TIP41
VDERIDRTLLLARDPILFFDELTLYESELDDNGTMSLTVKARARRVRMAYGVLVLWLASACPSSHAGAAAVTCIGAEQVRVMPSCWYVLLRYWLRVDNVLLRCVTRRHHATCPLLVRAICGPYLAPARRLRETRVFCKTAPGGAGGATLLRERSLREETFEALRERCERANRYVLGCCCARVHSSDTCFLAAGFCSGAPATVAQYPDAETASQVLLAAGGPVAVTYERLDIPA